MKVWSLKAVERRVVPIVPNILLNADGWWDFAKTKLKYFYYDARKTLKHRYHEIGSASNSVGVGLADGAKDQ